MKAEAMTDQLTERARNESEWADKQTDGVLLSRYRASPCLIDAQDTSSTATDVLMPLRYCIVR
jgi:hypothetical protein